MSFNKKPSIITFNTNEPDIIGDKKTNKSNELINTVPWKVHTEKNFDWIANMTHHMRYKDQEMKYKLKDDKLLELGWKSICKSNEEINEESCCVIPLEETSKRIQKKFKNMTRAHLSDWNLQYTNCFEQNTEAEEINNRTKLIGSVMKHLPTVNGKIVLDIQRNKKGAGIPTKQKKDEQNSRGRIHRILTGTHYLLFPLEYNYMNRKCITNDYETNLIKKCNTILSLFPRNLDEKYYNKNQDRFFPQSAIEFIGRFMAEALYFNKSSLITLRGCAAAIRLSSETRSVKNTQHYISEIFPMIVPMIIYQAVEAQTKENTPRPFFSVNKLKRIEDELGIGIYSTHNLKCNECGAIDDDDDVEVKLNKCDGCNRVWYCGNKCQEKNWLKHKRVCKNRWRKKSVYLKSKLTYDIMKKMVMKDNNGDGVNFRVQVDVTTGDTFMYCLDPDTNELFDGLTDRPIHFLSCSEH